MSHRREAVNIEGDRKKHSSNQRQVSTDQLEVWVRDPGFHAFHVWIAGSPAVGPWTATRVLRRWRTLVCYIKTTGTLARRSMSALRPQQLRSKPGQPRSKPSARTTRFLCH